MPRRLRGYDMSLVYLRHNRYGRTKRNRRECSGGCKAGSPRYHDSMEEARYCDQLALLVKQGELRSYKSQVTYYLKDAHGAACGWMRVDFEVIRADGKKQIHEYKGKLFATLPEYRIKKALFSWNYPELEHITVQKRQIIL